MENQSTASSGNSMDRVDLMERRVLSKISALDQKIELHFERLHEVIRSQDRNRAGDGAITGDINYPPHDHHHHHHHHRPSHHQHEPLKQLQMEKEQTEDRPEVTKSLPHEKSVSLSLPGEEESVAIPSDSPDAVVTIPVVASSLETYEDEKTEEYSNGDGDGGGSESESISDDDDSSRCSDASSMASSFRDAGFQPDDDEDDEAAKGPNVLVESDSGMINPKKAFRMSWDICVLLPFLLYLTVIMPFRLCFVNEPRPFTAIYWFEFAIDIVFIIDIFFNFFTGVVLEGDFLGEDGRSVVLVEYDRKRVAWNYLTTWFALDVVSGVPFALIELLLGGGTKNASSLKSVKSLKLLRFLKLGRLLKLDKMLSNLDRNTLDIIEDFLHNQKTQAIVLLVELVIIMCFSCHLMACGWVSIGRAGVLSGEDSWFNNDIYGPFEARDTTGGKWVSTIYLSAFYFSLTTMTSVGYGDLNTKNDIERLYVLALELSGAFIFATVIALITALVTTEDANSRNKKEQLEMVTSFCESRQFPDIMARRIRRHFRKFYETKLAIDEAKIFSELSTPLRKEVSAYLIENKMGSDSFFKRMGAHLWPLLLPMLRPMSFDKDEVACVQGEDASDMYTVLNGVLACSNQLPGEAEPRVRHAGAGHTVNLLHALCVWSKCMETASAKVHTETYALSQEDFKGLYTSETDLEAFQTMRRHEVRNYHMEFSGHVGGSFTDLGRPLCFTCFSSVALTLRVARLPDLGSVAEAREAMKADKKNSKSKSPQSWRRSLVLQSTALSLENLHAFAEKQHEEEGPHLGHAWAVADLIDATNGKVLSENWRYKTEKAAISFIPESEGISGNGGHVDFSELIRWDDIDVQFDNVAVRVRVYVDAAAQGAGAQGEKLVGRSLVALADWEQKQKNEASASKATKKNERKSSLSKPLSVSSFGRAEVNKQVEEWAPLEEPLTASAAKAARRRSVSGSFRRNTNAGERIRELGSQAHLHLASVRSKVLGGIPEGESPEPSILGEVQLLINARRPWRPRKQKMSSRFKAAKIDSAVGFGQLTPDVPKSPSSRMAVGMFPGVESASGGGGGGGEVELANVPTAGVTRRRQKISFDATAETSTDAPESDEASHAQVSHSRTLSLDNVFL